MRISANVTADFYDLTDLAVRAAGTRRPIVCSVSSEQPIAVKTVGQH